MFRVINRYRFRYSFVILVIFYLLAFHHELCLTLTDFTLGRFFNILIRIVISSLYIFVIAETVHLLCIINVKIDNNPLFQTTTKQDLREEKLMPNKIWQYIYVFLLICSLFAYLFHPYNRSYCVYYICFWIFSGIMFLYLIIRFDTYYYPSIVNEFHFFQIIDSPVISMISIIGIELTALSVQHLQDFIYIFIYFSNAIAIMLIVSEAWNKNLKLINESILNSQYNWYRWYYMYHN